MIYILSRMLQYKFNVGLRLIFFGKNSINISVDLVAFIILLLVLLQLTFLKTSTFTVNHHTMWDDWSSFCPNKGFQAVCDTGDATVKARIPLYNE